MIRKLTILIAAALMLASCVKDDYGPTPYPVRVLLVYVGTDNNLSGYEQAKIQGLRDGWTGRENDHIIVYRDTKGADARLMEVSNLAPGEAPREIATYGTENSASGAVLSRVISDVSAIYPNADSYGLLVFSHASGWLPAGTLYNPNTRGGNFSDVLSDVRPEDIPAIANSQQSQISELLNSTFSHSLGDGLLATDYDQSKEVSLPATSQPQTRSVLIDGQNEMELADFAAAIPDGTFDYIIFETCFMAGIEVAFELRNKASLIFASSAEILHPGFAPIYPSATAKLIGQDLAGFGQSVFTHTLTYAEGNLQRSGTYSVISTAGLESLAAFVRDNCDFSRMAATDEVQRFDRLNGYRLFFDFEDYYGRLLENDEQRAELSRLVADCVVWKAATGTFMTQQAGYNGFTINKHSGLTTYIPQTSFAGLNEAYDALGWARTTR